MTGGEAYKAKLLTEDALEAATGAYLADSSKPAVLETGKHRLDLAAAVLAHQWSADTSQKILTCGRGRTQGVDKGL